MTDQRIMVGIEDLTGRQFNGIQIERLVSRHPVRWQVRCLRCNTNWVDEHARVRYIGCRNSSCGRSPLEPRHTLANTGQAVTAVRSRDSESARHYEREQNQQPVKWAEQPTSEGMLNADPSSVRAYIDYQERKANART